MAITWPLLPDGSEVPTHRRSWKSQVEGYPIFCASSWVRQGNRGVWICGYCQRRTSDTLSPHQSDTLADCSKCGKTNRISL